MSRSVYIAYTGGTIGMKRTAQGYHPAPGFLVEQLQTPAFRAPELPEVTLSEYDPLLDSAAMTPANWEGIAGDIARNYAAFDGFVVLHGTDTMAYSASALSFMLENLGKPVILTGSQIPLAEFRSDARENLITALLLAAHAPLYEVGLYFGGVLLRGNRARKASASGFGAFTSPNAPPLGTVGVDIALTKALLLPPPTAPLCVRPLGAPKLAALRLFPGISAVVVKNVLRAPLEGLVLETYGSGNAPPQPDLLAVLEEATARGVVVVNCTQCWHGGVDMEGYATGRLLAAAGVTGGRDLTPEAALTKLAYLLGSDHPPEVVRRLMGENLRGELTPGLGIS